MKKTLFLIAALPSLIASCATDPNAPVTASLREEKEFTTGSNLPKRKGMGGDGVSVMTPQEFERARTAGGQGGGGTMPGTAQ
jgi:hypothetical protein